MVTPRFFQSVTRLAWCRVLAAVLVGNFISPIFAGDNLEKEGKRLYALCSACHGPGALGNQQFQAPSLVGLPSWYLSDQINKFRDGRRGAHHQDTAGLLMRPMSKALRSEEEVEAVVAYLVSLEPKVPEPTLTGGDPKKGEALYAVCAACHGQQLEGNPVLKTPSLRYLPDWYQLAQLKKYKAGIRGASDPTDAQAMQMMAITAGNLGTEEAMLDVMAFVNQMVKKPAPPPAPVSPEVSGEAASSSESDAEKAPRFSTGEEN